MTAFTTLVEPRASPNPFWIRAHLRKLEADEATLVAVRFSVGDLARRYGVTRRQLERYFRDELGVSPKEWLQARRMDLAVRLLVSGSSVKAVALHLGFSSSSALAERFRRHHGCVPSRLRDGSGSASHPRNRDSHGHRPGVGLPKP